MGGGSSVAGGGQFEEGSFAEYDAVYTEWGQLGITLQTAPIGDGSSAITNVVSVNEIAAAAGVAIGSHLLLVNNQPIVGMSHNQVIDLISEASWPKTLRFQTTDLAHVERVKRTQDEGGGGGLRSRHMHK
jgi:hypothetical protein